MDPRLPATDTHELRSPLWNFQERLQNIQSRVDDIQSAVRDVQSNTQRLLLDIQQYLGHNAESPNTQPTSTSSTHRTKKRLSLQYAKLSSTGVKAECPHPDCANKIKNQFSCRKNLKRHYMSHMIIDELCLFCAHNSKDIFIYVTHYNNCSTRKKQEREGSLHIGPGVKANQRREELLKMADDHLDQQLSNSRNRRVASGLRPPSRAKRRSNHNELTERSLKDKVIPETGIHVEQMSMDPGLNEQPDEPPPTRTATVEAHTAPVLSEDEPSRNREHNELQLWPQSATIPQATWNDTSRVDYQGCDDPLPLRAPFGASYTMDESSCNVSLPLRAPFGASYTMDDSTCDLPVPMRVPFGASYTMDVPHRAETAIPVQTPSLNEPLHANVTTDAHLASCQSQVNMFPLQPPCSVSYDANEPIDQFHLAQSFYTPAAL